MFQVAATGETFMTALEAAIAAISANTTSAPESQLIAAKCRALVVGYDQRYRDATYMPLEVEQTTVVPLLNPQTNRPSRLFSLAGKLDVVCTYHGQTILFDHKTTSLDIADPNSPYWRQLVVEAQASHYCLLKWISGTKIDGCVWDVLRKPSIAPKKLSKAEVRAVVSGLGYFGRSVSEHDKALVMQDERETPAMYESRLLRDCTEERPDWYFQRRSVPRLDADILDYASDLWQHAADITACRHVTERTGRWPQANSGACMLYGSPCKFLGICSTYDTPDSDKWAHKTNVHTELPELRGDGRNLLTNSRVRCFQTCRRKHHFEYELGIERIDEEERESLLFGRFWHIALQAWWSTFLPKEPDNGNCIESPGTESDNISARQAPVSC